jgi:urease accessory protein
VNEGAFLAALQLADSALPIGRFAHSYGLEAVYRAEPGLGEAELQELVATFASESVATLDGRALVLACEATELGDVAALVALDRRVTAHKTVPASRASSTACGRRLAVLALELVDHDACTAFARLVRQRESDGNLAVMEGAFAAAASIPAAHALLLELRGSAAAMLAAAVRLGHLPATRAQVVLRALEPDLLAAASRATLADAPFTSTAPELDVYALVQSRLEGRVFAS